MPSAQECVPPKIGRRRRGRHGLSHTCSTIALYQFLKSDEEIRVLVPCSQKNSQMANGKMSFRWSDKTAKATAKAFYPCTKSSCSQLIFSGATLSWQKVFLLTFEKQWWLYLLHIISCFASCMLATLIARGEICWLSPCKLLTLPQHAAKYPIHDNPWKERKGHTV